MIRKVVAAGMVLMASAASVNAEIETEATSRSRVSAVVMGDVVGLPKDILFEGDAKQETPVADDTAPKQAQETSVAQDTTPEQAQKTRMHPVVNTIYLAGSTAYDTALIASAAAKGVVATGAFAVGTVQTIRNLKIGENFSLATRMTDSALDDLKGAGSNIWNNTVVYAKHFSQDVVAGARRVASGIKSAWGWAKEKYKQFRSWEVAFFPTF